MKQLADISGFLSLNKRCGVQNSSMAVFNTNVDDIKRAIEEWQQVIDAMRSIPADPEAELEESKVEKFLSTMKEKIEAAVQAGRTSITELKRSGAYETQEDEQQEPAQQGPDTGGMPDMGDMGDMGGNDDTDLFGSGGEEPEGGNEEQEKNKK